MFFRSSNLILLLVTLTSSVLSWSTQSPASKAHVQRIQNDGSNIPVESTMDTTATTTTATMNRRKTLTTLLSGVATVAFTGVQTASAKDELFKPNPLTNKFLEQVRILEQAEQDNLVYKGELAPGAPPLRNEYANLLVPILTMQQELVTVDGLVHQGEGNGLKEADGILNGKEFEKKQFKKTFNAFADNIYYSDPDRANAYLGGGAVPKNEQSIAYLIRNDILTNLENLQAEVAYLIKTKEFGETDDLYSYSNLCVDGLDKYLALVPPPEVAMAKRILAEKN